MGESKKDEAANRGEDFDRSGKIGKMEAGRADKATERAPAGYTWWVGKVERIVDVIVVGGTMINESVEQRANCKAHLFVRK